MVSHSSYVPTDNIDAHQFVDEMVISNTLKRRDVWDDRETAIQWLSKRSPWKFWDPRALQLYSVRLRSCSARRITDLYITLCSCTASAWSATGPVSRSAA